MVICQAGKLYQCSCNLNCSWWLGWSQCDQVGLQEYFRYQDEWNEGELHCFFLVPAHLTLFSWQEAIKEYPSIYINPMPLRIMLLCGCSPACKTVTISSFLEYFVFLQQSVLLSIIDQFQMEVLWGYCWPFNCCEMFSFFLIYSNGKVSNSLWKGTIYYLHWMSSLTLSIRTVNSNRLANWSTDLYVENSDRFGSLFVVTKIENLCWQV